MTSILSVYYAPWHWREKDMEYVRRLNPAWVRIHQPSARAIANVQAAAPEARIMLRSWDIDDSNGDRKRELYADPLAAAQKHMGLWGAKRAELRMELRRSNLPYDESKWFFGLVNEPDPAYLPLVITYTLQAMHMARESDMHLGVVASSVGTFGRPGEGGNTWDLCKSLEAPINDGGHILIVHEYWQPEGPSAVWTDNEGGERKDAGNLAWRHRSIPLNVPILIGEAGANGYLYNRHSAQDDAGWRKFMNGGQYATQVLDYIEGCDQRVQGVCLYMTDFHSDQWESFDTEPAMEQLLAIKDATSTVVAPVPTLAPPTVINLPIVVGPEKPLMPNNPPNTTSLLRWPLDTLRVTQWFGENPAAYARFGLRGHNGIDFSCVIGTPVKAVADGVVAWVDTDAAYGNYIRIWHKALGVHSFHAHLSKQNVKQGDVVKQGQVIGLSGNTGNSTGPHLHFELRPCNDAGAYVPQLPGYGKTCDPVAFMAGVERGAA